MLTSLSVRDFAIVDRINVDFAPGMTVLTGETGAGKSILVDALGLVLGDRGSSQMVRDGARRAEFSATFEMSSVDGAADWLEAQELDADDECIVRRVIGADGRSRAFINGNAVPLQQLRALGDMLVDIHGQHFHQSLGRPAVQRQLLDHYAGAAGQCAETGAAFDEWKRIEDRLEALRTADADRASRLDLLTFQVDELRAVDPRADEFGELTAERQRLAGAGRLLEGTQAALSALSTGDEANAGALIAAAQRAIEPLLDVDAALGPLAELLDSAQIQVAEAADDLQRYADAVEMDPERQHEVESRLDTLTTLARKHRTEPAGLADVLATLEQERAELDDAEARGEELARAAGAARERYLELAEALSAQRKAAAARFSTEVSDAMAGLGMPGGVFEIVLGRLDPDNARRSGIDSVEFRISANPGQRPMPLSKVASGGELSRMSLAIQVIASDGSAIPTMVFDEVDSGVGGGVAEMVGRRLCDLGGKRQVLCVTHLPQVASLAHQQLCISKVTDGKATRTGVRQLDDQERVEELARMLGGVEITRKTLDHAREMLEKAPKKRA